jgi:hypothetical protein
MAYQGMVLLASMKSWVLLDPRPTPQSVGDQEH